MPEGLEKIAESIHKGAIGMERTEKAAEGLALSMGQIARGALTYQAINQALHTIVSNSVIMQAITQATHRESLSKLSLMNRELEMVKARTKAEQNLLDSDVLVRDLAKEELKSLDGQMKVLDRQKVLSERLNSLGNVRLNIAMAYVGLLASAYRTESQFNETLIKANSSSDHRLALERETYAVQARLGATFGKVTQAAAALASYSLDTKVSFGDNLRIVTQMEAALGVSVNESASLAALVENRLHGSFQSVADVVADIVDNTALAGEEATRLAHLIGSAMSRLRPGMSAVGLPDVVRLAGRYEGALKEIGGNSGDLGQLINQLTSAHGLVAQGMLGISPDFIASKEGFQTAMDRFAKLGNQMVNSTNSQQRLQQLQMFAQQFGLSADQANLLLMMTKRLSAEQNRQVTLQERWRNQMHSTNAGLTRLGNTLMGMVQSAVLPAVQLFGWLVNKLADFAEVIAKYKGLSTVIGIGLLAGAISLVPALWGVATAMYQVVAASVAAAAAARAEALAKGTAGLGGATGVAGLGGRLMAGAKTIISGLATFFISALSSTLTASFAVLLNPFGALLVGLTAVSLAAKQLTQAQLEQTKILQAAHNDRKLQARDAYTRGNSELFNAVRFGGDPTAVISRITENYQRQRGMTKDSGTMVALDREYQEELAKIQSTAQFALTSKDLLTTKTATRDAEDAEIQKKIAEATKKSAELAKANIQQDKERLNAEMTERAKQRAITDSAATSHAARWASNYSY